MIQYLYSHEKMAAGIHPPPNGWRQRRDFRPHRHLDQLGRANGDRVAVFYSPLDLSVGLVGQPIDGIAGYSPETATKIVSSIVSYAAGH